MDEYLFFAAMAWFLGVGLYITFELLAGAVLAAVRRRRVRRAAEAAGPRPHVPSWARQDGDQ